MVAAVRQIVKIEANGRIEILSPELRAGTTAEVIVLLPPPPSDLTLTPAEKVAALCKLRESVALTPESAEKWKQEVRDERDAWNPTQK